MTDYSIIAALSAVYLEDSYVSTFALCCELGDDRGRRRCGVIVT